MATVGERKTLKVGRGYEKDPMYNQAKEFLECVQDVLNESNVSLFTEATKAFMHPGACETLRRLFVENSADRESFETDEDYEEHLNDMNEMFLNDKEGLLEHTAGAEISPVVGMTIPMHKNLLMNCIFAQAFQKVVATTPKWTETMEIRYLVDTEGNLIDMYKDQAKIGKAIMNSNPYVEVTLALPESGKTDLLKALNASSLDNLSIDTHISAIQVSVDYKQGDVDSTGTTITDANGVTKDDWFEVNYNFTPGYGDVGRVMTQPVLLDSIPVNGGATEDLLQATMKDNKVTIVSVHGVVKAVKLAMRKDPTNGLLDTCEVKWNQVTIPVEMGPGIPINVPVHPDEVKDIGALFQVNQITKLMSMIKIALENYKDDEGLAFLDKSMERLPESDSLRDTYDMEPRGLYALDHVEWRYKTFMDEFETSVNKLFYVLNDPNVTVTILGRPDIVRKLTPNERVYQTPSSIGPVELDFVRTVVNASDKRTYQFLSSQKLRDREDLIIILNPRNTDRIIYRLYDYMLYMSNEIRNKDLYTLPAMHSYERFKYFEYQPVQGRVTVLNPKGYKVPTAATDTVTP